MNINNSERDKNKLHPGDTKIDRSHSARDLPTDDDDDCFIKLGFVSSSKERNQTQKSSEPEQPAYLVEEIDAITALFIYDVYTKKQKTKLNPKQRMRAAMSPNSICDDIDRFDSIYSCLIDQTSSSQNRDLKKSYRVQNYLRDRFVTLPEIDAFKEFQQNEQSRVYEEKQAVLNRVPFIPNILAHQRTCPFYNLNEIKRIQDQLN
ncbi:unnamed protein product [Rotaria socialis]|uniref:Uncharacterized protein n=1 Tax=Rotaria socialis TaxID=392032 RepID=A0A817V205_9BILA|nr:unnamed protein product [Rotaria socialis]CAF3348358.1 unnamed protein product [Rotaria socialis]CAF3363714.1 unnamed protein product [Rotaria socialis]CAF3586247.1 unnamed protein product [Rotaria socialis]CAF3719745.1 unnamed protein product [Rotaria socialis]